MIFFFLTGCAVYRPPPERTAAYQTASLEELLEQISARDSKVSTVKADFSASVTDLQNGKSQSCSGVLGMEKPDKLRMQGSQIMLPTLFDLLWDGTRLTLYVPKEKTIYRSGNSPDSSRRGLAAVKLLTELFIGERSESGRFYFLESSPRQYIVYYVEQGGSRMRLLKKIFFDRRDLSATRYQYFDDNGVIVCDVHCSDFIRPPDAARRPLPREAAIDAPPGKTRISLRLKNLRVNTPVSPALFTFTPPPGTTVRPLEEFGE